MKNNPEHLCFELPLRAVLRVTGEDAASFLQGQFSNELQKESGACVYGLWLNQKGKVVADSYVLRVGPMEFLVISERCEAAAIQQRLEQYIIADDVSVSDETANYRALVVWGGEAVVANFFGVTLPLAGRFVSGEDGLAFLARSGADSVYLLVGTQKQIGAWSGSLRAADFGWIDANAAEYRRICAGVPAIPSDIGASDLPNEGGLEASAISFTKGCYLGQEVMARLKNLGQVRRRLHIVTGVGLSPAALVPLYQGEIKVGEIRSSASASETGQFVSWAMLSLVTFKADAGLQLAPDHPATIHLYPHG